MGCVVDEMEGMPEKSPYPSYEVEGLVKDATYIMGYCKARGMTLKGFRANKQEILRAAFAEDIEFARAHRAEKSLVLDIQASIRVMEALMLGKEVEGESEKEALAILVARRATK